MTRHPVFTPFLLGIILCLGIVFPAHARPKIGLCLSGGGARGAAHIGVIRVLEELNIPVDCIAGTSMGAIVGGLYAAGMPIEEIERIAQESDWDSLLTDRVPRSDLPYRRKHDPTNYFLGLDVDFTDGIVLPRGLIPGKRLDLLLRSLTLNVSRLEDFDTLPIPFRAVATDIETGEAVVLAGGDLARALRASMAIPGVFSPVIIDGRMLVDGGVARNLPVDVLRQMGADIIIAVNIGSPLLEQQALKSFIAVSGQLSRILTNRNVSEQIESLNGQDVLIAPELGDIRTGDFHRCGEAIAIGRLAALDLKGPLSRYSLDRAAYGAIRQERACDVAPSVFIEFIEVDHPSLVSSRTIRKGLRKRMHSLLDLDMDILSYDIFRVYEQYDLDDIMVKLAEKDGRQGLQLSAREKSRPAGELKFGLTLEDDFEGDSAFDIHLSFTAQRINRLGAQWHNQLSIGEHRRLFSEFYQPLDPYLWTLFVAPWGAYESYMRDIYYRDRRLAEYKITSALLGFDIGLQMSGYGELRFGVLRGNKESALFTGSPSLPEDNLQQGAYRLNLTIDQLDDPDFPRRGSHISATYLASRIRLGADDAYERLSLEMARPLTWSRHTLMPAARIGTTLSSSATLPEYFALGGFLNLSGLKSDQFYGQHALMAQLVYLYKVWEPKIGFLNGVYVGGSLEAGGVWNKRSRISFSRGDLTQAGSLFLASDTPLGPLYLAWGHAEGDQDAFYLLLGHAF